MHESIRKAKHVGDNVVLRDEEIRSETELEEILINNPEQIEEGFKLLRTQRRATPYGKRLDVLGVDSKGTLTVIELKIKEDEEQLLQAIEYFDWLLERGVSFFRDHFSEQGIANKTPRIILIAPVFSERTVKLCKYISEDIQVSLKQYLCFSTDVKKVIKLVDKSIPSRREIEQPPSKMEDHVNWIVDEKVRDVFSETIELIKKLDQNKIRLSLLPYRINFIHTSNGLKFAELYSRRNYFLITWKDAEGEWDEAKVTTSDEAHKIVDERVRKAMELVKQSS
jgi:hypothetical protein